MICRGPRRPMLPLRAAAFVATLVAVHAHEARAFAAPANQYDIRVGFDGVFRTGSWTPVSIVFPAAASGHAALPEAVCVWVEDPDGQFVRSPAAAVVREADGTSVARLTVRFGRPAARLLVGQAGDGMPGARRATALQSVPPPLPATETVMLVLGELPAAERASRLLSRDDGTRPRVVAVRPEAGGGRSAAPWIGRTARDFDGADWIVVCGSGVAAWDPAVLAGIDAWVRQGGRLVFLAGGSAADIDLGRGTAAEWLPGRVSRLVPLRRGNAIETYARASRPLDKSAFTALEIPLLENPRAVEGSVEAFEGRGAADLPLVVRRAHGLGTVVWAGLDLDQPPFRGWSGSDSLLVEMLRGRRGSQESGRAGETERGTLDLAGQLRQAIDQFPGVAPIPFEVIAGLGLLYVACLYPLDWWLGARRLRGDAPGGPWSTAAAWLSLPIIVVAASGLTWAAGRRYKAPEWRTSAAQLVDLDVGTGLVRAASFTGVWSPENALLDLTVTPHEGLLPSATAAQAGDVSWFAPCGRGIGGTDAAAAHPSLASVDYGYAAGSAASLDGVPIAASSSRLFESELVVDGAVGCVASTLAREGQGTLKGAVTSRLPFSLADCVLVHAGWLYDVGTLASGGSFEPGLSRGPRSLAGALTRRTLNKDRDVAVRWNVAERDPLRILEVAGFHAAAGGSGYTSLEPGRLARFDLSPILPLDRAVLMGRGPAFVAWQRRARMLADADAAAEAPPASDNPTLWRLVIPLVRPTSAPSPNPPAD